jgi:hypothetical protein
MTSTPKIYTAMAQAMAMLAGTGIGKTGRNAQQGYNYRSIDAILNHLSTVLPEVGLVIFPAYELLGQVEYATKNGGTMTRATVQATFTVVASEDGSSHQFSTIGEAADSGDKSIGKAQSYALKKALEQVFCIPFEGQDSDADSHERSTAATPVQTGNELLSQWKELAAVKNTEANKLQAKYGPAIKVDRQTLQAMLDELKAA